MDTSKSFLHSKSTRHNEKYFALQNQTSNFDQKNVNKSDTTTNNNKETVNIDKETINNNQKRNKECITVSTQQSNQDTLMTSLKRQYQIQLIMPNHGEMIIEILK